MSHAQIVAAAEAVRVAAVTRRAWLSELVVAGIGWATVELDRAEAELSAALGESWMEAEADELLGATARIRSAMLDDTWLVLLEPSTEGRLAASLARFGEGVAAIYLARGAGHTGGSAEQRDLSRIGSTPLGPARLVLGGPLWGPSAIVLEPTS